MKIKACPFPCMKPSNTSSKPLSMTMKDTHIYSAKTSTADFFSYQSKNEGSKTMNYKSKMSARHLKL